MNLCTNAFHAMEDTGGMLTVKLEKCEPDSDLNLPDGEYCCVTVSDTGVGIPNEL
ncbi:ATP-binding protein [Desulfobacter hydrogenophilus]|nr:hypothetical protein [Desulfobacter hydrogenophilus]QBH12045.1 ATP-binding protein [Desulfobacter hydrogenophilus]